ncbi:hypothetical protein CU098_012200, partial [Rhizopus stolonifer]
MEVPTQVGSPIPAHTPHAVSVTLPTWQDNVFYEEANPIVTSKMQCGYPRFFIHPLIQKLCARLVSKFGKENDAGMLFPSHKVAEQCRSFMKRYYQNPTGTVRIAEFDIASHQKPSDRVPIHIILFPQEAFPIAKQFWQHAGDNITSRMAEYCLRILEENDAQANKKESTDDALYRPKLTMGSRSRSHYSSNKLTKPTEEQKPKEEGVEQVTYLEERYGRNLPVVFANNAKVALKRRIAGVLMGHVDFDHENHTSVHDLDEQRQSKGDRGIQGLSEEDVYLYPCGMSSIFHAHQIAMLVGDASLKS